MTIEIPLQFTHSIKIGETTKGIRISVHIYTNDQEKAIKEAFDTYMTYRAYAKNLDIPLAPFEVSKK